MFARSCSKCRNWRHSLRDCMRHSQHTQMLFIIVFIDQRLRRRSRLISFRLLVHHQFDRFVKPCRTITVIRERTTFTAFRNFFYDYETFDENRQSLLLFRKTYCASYFIWFFGRRFLFRSFYLFCVQHVIFLFLYFICVSSLTILLLCSVRARFASFDSPPSSPISSSSFLIFRSLFCWK